jgi:DNA-binding FadR family transcriptional regulator
LIFLQPDLSKKMGLILSPPSETMVLPKEHSVSDDPEVLVTPSSADRILAYLRDRIVSGALKPGDRIPAERELAQQLGVGRPLLREVTRSMTMLGLLETRQGAGTFVGRADISFISNFLGFCLSQEQGVMDDVMNARMGLERQAVRLACERASDADFERIAHWLDALLRTIDDPEAGGDADFRFHQAIIAASHSRSVIALYGSLSDLIRRSHIERRRTTYRERAVVGDLVEAHREVFLSILSRDVSEADAKICQHFTIGDELRRKSLIAAWRKASETGPADETAREVKA